MFQFYNLNAHRVHRIVSRQRVNEDDENWEVNGGLEFRARFDQHLMMNFPDKLINVL